MSFTNRTAKGLLDYLFSETSVFDTPPTLSLAAFTTTPGEDGTGGAEAANANGYARVLITAGAFTGATLADPAAMTNALAIAFPTASGGSFGTITTVCLMDSNTVGAGNVLAIAPLSSSRTINDGDVLNFPIGGLSFTLD